MREFQRNPDIILYIIITWIKEKNSHTVPSLKNMMSATLPPLKYWKLTFSEMYFWFWTLTKLYPDDFICCNSGQRSQKLCFKYMIGQKCPSCLGLRDNEDFGKNGWHLDFFFYQIPKWHLDFFFYHSSVLS